VPEEKKDVELKPIPPDHKLTVDPPSPHLRELYKQQALSHLDKGSIRFGPHVVLSLINGLEELEQLFEIQRAVCLEAEKLWRKATGAPENLVPSLTKLLRWLLARSRVVDAVREEPLAVEATLKELQAIEDQMGGRT